jgi:hypothetical protein
MTFETVRQGEEWRASSSVKPESYIAQKLTQQQVQPLPTDLFVVKGALGYIPTSN